ncbi:MAG: hypothetical protein HZC12_07310 [Nitrospirae bacterium]|nr:hypothetical protein [Nitrospirota bacterium]
MKIGTKEKGTICALNNISQKYPFAASLLAYAIIERIFKEYIIKNRKNKSLVDYSYYKSSSSGQISLGKYYKCKKGEFIKKFIKRITLGDAQIIVIANKKKNYATARNDLMHSNSYLLEQRKYTKTKRRNINIQNYRNAIKHLKFVINSFSDFKIVVRNNVISIS